MKIKAIHKSFDNKPCIITPIFFPKESGLQFKVIQGSYSGSIFACKYDEFEFDLFAKFQILTIKIWYYVKMIFWRKLRHQYPHKIRLFFHPIKDNEMPF